MENLHSSMKRVITKKTVGIGRFSGKCCHMFKEIIFYTTAHMKYKRKEYSVLSLRPALLWSPNQTLQEKKTIIPHEHQHKNS